MSNTAVNRGESKISCDEALKIARTDAESLFDDLSIDRISIALGENGWLVACELKESNLPGGGPLYIIDVTTGEILSKRYEQ